jgi:hypothetical protein
LIYEAQLFDSHGIPKKYFEKVRMKNIERYSNPDIVRRNADKYLGSDIPIFLSTRATKKYMVKGPDGKWIHFGQYGMEDYTLHRNNVRREAFRIRNHKWETSKKWSPAWLSYWLLW